MLLSDVNLGVLQSDGTVAVRKDQSSLALAPAQLCCLYDQRETASLACL